MVRKISTKDGRFATVTQSTINEVQSHSQRLTSVTAGGGTLQCTAEQIL